MTTRITDDRESLGAAATPAASRRNPGALLWGCVVLAAAGWVGASGYQMMCRGPYDYRRSTSWFSVEYSWAGWPWIYLKVEDTTFSPFIIRPTQSTTRSLSKLACAGDLLVHGLLLAATVLALWRLRAIVARRQFSLANICFAITLAAVACAIWMRCYGPDYEDAWQLRKSSRSEERIHFGAFTRHPTWVQYGILLGMICAAAIGLQFAAATTARVANALRRRRPTLW